MIRLSLGKKAPSEIRLFRKGKNQTRKGTFIFDNEAAKLVMANFAEHGAKIAFDYDHGSTSPTFVPPSQAGKAAGRGMLAVLNGELWAVDIKWTKPAQLAIEAEEWMYVSPTFRHVDGRVTQLICVAITNIPATDDPMPLIELSQEQAEELAEWSTEYVNDLPDSAFLWIAPGGEKDEQDKTVPRDSRKLPIYDAEGKLDLPHLRNALARCEQTEGPSDEEKVEIMAKAKALLDEATKTEEPKEEPMAEEQAPVVEEACKKEEKLSESHSFLVELTGAASESEAVDTISSWRNSHEQLSIVVQELSSLKKSYDALERETLISKNAAKIPGKLAEWAQSQSTETLKAYFASAPDVVPTKLMEQPRVEKVVSLSDEEKAIAKAFGLSEEKALAYKKRMI